VVVGSYGSRRPSAYIRPSNEVGVRCQRIGNKVRGGQSLKRAGPALVWEQLLGLLFIHHPGGLQTTPRAASPNLKHVSTLAGRPHLPSHSLGTLLAAALVSTPDPDHRCRQEKVKGGRRVLVKGGRAAEGIPHTATASRQAPPSHLSAPVEHPSAA
jgi:hypothetical protein